MNNNELYHWKYVSRKRGKNGKYIYTYDRSNGLKYNSDGTVTYDPSDKAKKYMDSAAKKEYKAEHPEDRSWLSKLAYRDKDYSYKLKLSASLDRAEAKKIVEKYGWMTYEDFCSKYGYEEGKVFVNKLKEYKVK